MTIVVQRVPYLRTDLDDYRADVVVHGDPVEVLAEGFDPEVTAEVDGVRIVQPAVLFLAPSQPAHPLDEWIINDDRYMVDGHPTPIRNDLSGRWHKTEIDLKRVTG